MEFTVVLQPVPEATVELGPGLEFTVVLQPVPEATVELDVG